jgi:hypothetical protein
MPKFYEQNKKRIDPRYFLHEQAEAGTWLVWNVTQALKDPEHWRKIVACSSYGTPEHCANALDLSRSQAQDVFGTACGRQKLPGCPEQTTNLPSGQDFAVEPAYAKPAQRGPRGNKPDQVRIPPQDAMFEARHTKK